MQSLVRARPPSSYTKKEIENIHLLSVFESPLPIPVGSASYVMQKYPSDLDLYQVKLREGTVREAVHKLAKRMQKVVKKIQNTPCHFITDIKAGADVRFDKDIGPLRDGVWYPNKENIEYMLTISAQTKNIRNTLTFSDQETTRAYDIFKAWLHEFEVYRWTPEEVIQGYKTQNGETVSLQDALNTKANIKIDVVTYLNNRFTEVTNMILIAAITDGDIKLINTAYDPTDPTQIYQSYTKSMRQEIEKLIYSKVHQNLFKACKRMWTLARILFILNKDKQAEDVLYQLLPLVGGDISALYQIKGEIEAIDLIKDEPCVKDKLRERTDEWRTVISTSPILDTNQMVELIKYSTPTSIDRLKKMLTEVIESSTLIFLKSLNLLPPPSFLLPKEPRYAGSG